MSQSLPSGAEPYSSPTPPPGASPYPGAPYSPQYTGPVSPKSRLVATLLRWFLGSLGVDRFYMGNIGLGVAKLLLGWLTLGIWWLVDFILVVAGKAKDGQGLPVTNWQA